jgi:hypothetical protein
MGKTKANHQLAHEIDIEKVDNPASQKLPPDSMLALLADSPALHAIRGESQSPALFERTGTERPCFSQRSSARSAAEFRCAPYCDFGEIRSTIMTSVKQLVVVAIFGVLAGSGLHAQSLDMRATIPFDFHAGQQLMPAGEYVIHAHDSAVLLRGADSRSPGAIFLTNRTTSGNPPEARLDFMRYGSEYFLTAIWSPITQDGRQVPQTARQRELARRGNVPAQIEVGLTSTK